MLGRFSTKRVNGSTTIIYNVVPASKAWKNIKLLYDGDMIQPIRFEGLTLTVESIDRSIEFYSEKLGFKVEHNAAPHFALIRVGEGDGGTIGFLSTEQSQKDGVESSTPSQKRAIHVELSTDNLDALFNELTEKGVEIQIPPHDEPWERSMTAYDPDGYSVEFAQGKRGSNLTH